MPAGSTQAGRLPQGFDLRESSERRGRPQTALRIREDSHAFVGVNIHDGAITVSEVNTMCRPIGSDITETVSNTAPQAVVEQITRMVRELVAASPDAPAPTALGLSLGGHVEDDRYVTFEMCIRDRATCSNTPTRAVRTAVRRSQEADSSNAGS